MQSSSSLGYGSHLKHSPPSELSAVVASASTSSREPGNWELLAGYLPWECASCLTTSDEFLVVDANNTSTEEVYSSMAAPAGSYADSYTSPVQYESGGASSLAAVLLDVPPESCNEQPRSFNGQQHSSEINHTISSSFLRQMFYRDATLKPLFEDEEFPTKPKRRNVKISTDPQSISARHRRERISQKIRILQRLVPGGTKMDTASMLDEAIRYVKFLQTQVQSLEMLTR